LQGYIIFGLPVIKEGDDIAHLVQSLFDFQDGDVLCIASTIVAKSEGRFRDLNSYLPSPRAAEIAKILGKTHDLFRLFWMNLQRYCLIGPSF